MPTRRVPRGAYERSCTECGWSAVYATEGMANSRMRRHNCTTYLRHAKRRTMTERYSAIDRTPKPCHHKRANHQHGTYACYTLDGCRCVPCADAQSAYETNRTRQQAYGRWDNLVDASPARAHVAALGEYGISLKQVARLTGISTGTLSKLVYGHYKPLDGPSRGRYGKGELLRGPSERVSKRLAAKVLAVELRPENFAASALDPHRTDEARTKLRSLLRIGWSMSRIGARLGMPHVRNATLLIKGDRPMMRRTVDAALALFDVTPSQVRAWAAAAGLPVGRGGVMHEACKRGHDLSVHRRTTKRGSTYCSECQRARARAWDAKKRQSKNEENSR